MEFYNAFSYSNLGDIDSLTKGNIKNFNVTTMDGRCYDGIADEISALTRERTNLYNEKGKNSRSGEVVYNINSSEIVYYILDFEGNRRYMVKQLYYLCEVGKQTENYLDNDDVRKLIDIINNYEDRTTFKRSEYSNKIIRRPFDINGKEIDFTPLILAIINKYTFGAARTKDSWNREFRVDVNAYQGKIKFQCWAESDSYYLHYSSMKYGGVIDTDNSEIIFDYVHFGSGSDK